jgi:hypothetical protein
MNEPCRVCGAELQFESCWMCVGAGGWHECGEDTCCCLDGEEITDWCAECQGEGGYLVCPEAQYHPVVDAQEKE